MLAEYELNSHISSQAAAAFHLTKHMDEQPFLSLSFLFIVIMQNNHISL